MKTTDTPLPKLDFSESSVENEKSPGAQKFEPAGKKISDLFQALSDVVKIKDMREVCLSAKKIVDNSPWFLSPSEEKVIQQSVSQLMQYEEGHEEISGQMRDLRAGLSKFLVS